MSSVSVRPLVFIATAMPRRLRSVMTSRRFGNQQRLAIDAGRHHRLGLGELVEHPARGIEVHDAFEGVDRVLVLKAPDRAHMAAQVAARGEIDEQPVRHLRELAAASSYTSGRPSRPSTNRASTIPFKH